MQRKSWSNVPPKVHARLHKVSKLYTKSAISESSIALGRLNLTFLSLGLSLWNLAHLFIMFMATKLASDFFNFALGLSYAYGLSKSKKWGKIITKLWKIITWGKIITKLWKIKTFDNLTALFLSPPVDHCPGWRKECSIGFPRSQQSLWSGIDSRTVEQTFLDRI